VAAQQLWWQRSNGGAAMGRSDGREGGGAAMAMTAQRRLRRCSDGNGDGGAVMGVAVVAVANQADALSWTNLARANRWRQSVGCWRIIYARGGRGGMKHGVNIIVRVCHRCN